MDFQKFYDWAYHAAIVDMTCEPDGVKPETRASVYALLVEDGIAVTDGTSYWLTTKGSESVCRARPIAARLLNELVKENHKLVRKLVGQIFKRTMAFVEEEDLYQSGCMAFVKALERFDPSRFSRKGMGGSFCTYLRHWIRDHTQRTTANAQLIHYPKGFGMPYQVHRAAEEILSKTGRQATAEELAAATQLDVTQAKLDTWRAALTSIVPLDTYVAGLSKGVMTKGSGGVADEGTWLSSGDAVDHGSNPEDIYERAETGQSVEVAMTKLTPMQRQVIEALLEGDTYRQVATRLKISEEYVRQLRAAAVAEIQGSL